MRLLQRLTTIPLRLRSLMLRNRVDQPSGTLAVSVVVVLAVIAVALLASWIPARRAACVDALDALRME